MVALQVPALLGAPGGDREASQSNKSGWTEGGQSVARMPLGEPVEPGVHGHPGFGVEALPGTERPVNMY